MMTDWPKVAQYLVECDNYRQHMVEEDTANIHMMDESITASLAGLRDVYGVDLEDEAMVFGLIVGFLVAYQYGCKMAMGEATLEAQAYLRRHGNISGHIGLVARQIAQNHGVTSHVEE